MVDEVYLAPEFRAQRMWGAGPQGADVLGKGWTYGFRDQDREPSGWRIGTSAAGRRGPGSIHAASEIGDEELLGAPLNPTVIPMRPVGVSQTGTQCMQPLPRRGGGVYAAFVSPPTGRWHRWFSAAPPRTTS